MNKINFLKNILSPSITFFNDMFTRKHNKEDVLRHYNFCLEALGLFLKDKIIFGEKIKDKHGKYLFIGSGILMDLDGKEYYGEVKDFDLDLYIQGKRREALEIDWYVAPPLIEWDKVFYINSQKANKYGFREYHKEENDNNPPQRNNYNFFLDECSLVKTDKLKCEIVLKKDKHNERVITLNLETAKQIANSINKRLIKE